MLKSMTGYGRCEGQRENKNLLIEIKAVNHRFSEVMIRLPKFLSPLEDRIRKKILTRVARGRLDVYFTMDNYGSPNKGIKVDRDLATAYYRALKELERDLAVPDNLGLKEIAQLPDVLKIEEKQEDLEEIWPWIDGLLEEALASLLKMREEEGNRLKGDLLDKLEKISKMVQEITLRAPKVVEEYRDRLLARIKDLVPDKELDENRLLTEVAIFADRCSIDEEIVRLQSHFKQMKDTLASREPVGRKLDFLMQEMNREINTIGSKANDLYITGFVVEVKSELEKMREQIQNIE